MLKYFIKDDARTHCARLETLVKLYVRALKFEVENRDTEKHNRALFEIGRTALEALGIDTLHDVHSWNDDFSALFCEDESTGLKGYMMDWTCRCTVWADDCGSGDGKLATFSMDSRVTSMCCTCETGALPWARFHMRLQQAWQAAEPTLRAADIKLIRRPLFKGCENGEQLIERMQRSKKDKQTVFRKLDTWQLKMVNSLETSLRHASRLSKYGQAKNTQVRPEDPGQSDSPPKNSLEFDDSIRTVSDGKRQVVLTPTHYKILRAAYRRTGMAVTWDLLCGPGEPFHMKVLANSTFKSHIDRLRKSLETGGMKHIADRVVYSTANSELYVTLRTA